MKLAIRMPEFTEDEINWLKEQASFDWYVEKFLPMILSYHARSFKPKTYYQADILWQFKYKVRRVIAPKSVLATGKTIKAYK